MGALLEPIDLEALTRAAYGILTLTPGEYRVLKSFLRGKRPQQIALELGLTQMTAQLYLKKIFRKCGCDRLTLMRLSFALDSIPTINRYLEQLGPVEHRPRRRNCQVDEPTPQAQKLPANDTDRFNRRAPALLRFRPARRASFGAR